MSELKTYTPISGMHCCCEESGDYVSKADYEAKALPPEVEAVKKFKAMIDAEIAAHKSGEMMSMAESIHGEAQWERVKAMLNQCLDDKRNEKDNPCDE